VLKLTLRLAAKVWAEYPAKVKAAGCKARLADLFRFRSRCPIWNRLLKLPCARFGGQRFGLVLR